MKKILLCLCLLLKISVLMCEAESSLNTFYANKIYNKYPLDTTYYSPKQIAEEIKALALKGQKQVKTSYSIIGASNNSNLPIYALSIAKQNCNPWVLIVGQHQSEEPIGIAVGFTFIKQILQNQASQNSILNKFNFVFVPTVNPEGYKIFYSGKNLAKRKNNTDTNQNGVLDIDDGVDLNKNYPINWEFDTNTDFASPYYKGKNAASEQEIIAMMKLYDEYNFQLAFFLHSSLTGVYSERIFFPYKHDDEISPDWFKLKNLADTLAFYLPKDYQEGNYKVHTENTSKKGFARDYVYKNYGTYAFTIENGGIVKAGKNKYSVVFPKNQQLQKIVSKNIKAITKVCSTYYANLHKVQLLVTDDSFYANQPYKLKNHAVLIKLKTNSFGYAFYYNPNKINAELNFANGFNAFINGNSSCSNQLFKNQSFALTKKQAGKVFLSNSMQDFGYFTKPTQIMVDNKVFFTKKYGNQFLLPWLNLKTNGYIKIANKQEYEYSLLSPKNKLSWFKNLSASKFYVIHPQTAASTFFNIVYKNQKTYNIKKIRFYIKPQQAKTKAIVNVYNKNKNKLVFSKKITVKKNSKVIDILPKSLPLSQNSLIELQNIGNNNIKLIQEDYFGSKSGCNMVFYSNRQKHKGNDFAIELTLQKQ